MTGPRPTAASAGAPNRLVNLTDHEVNIDVVPPPPTGDPSIDGHSGDPLIIATSGSVARVRDAETPANPLATTAVDGSRLHIAHVELGRRADLVDLPDPQPGTYFVVSRLTAWAARGRRDLLFPHDEHRDPRGAVVGARKLARFDPAGWRVRTLLHRSWARLRGRLRWHPRRWPLKSPVPIAVAFSIGTALLGAAAGDVPNLITTGAHDPSHARHWLFTGGFGGIGVLALIFGWALWHRRRLILHDRGTAYVIEETADSWTHEEKESFLTRLHEEFGAVIRVPGPAALGRRWGWPLGKGADEWREHLAELVRAFWAVHYNDDQVTLNAIFVWAFWPVAIGFGARATSGRRGLVMHSHQRPSFGAQGIHVEFDPRRDSHDFLDNLTTAQPHRPANRVANDAPSGAVPVVPGALWPVSLTVLPPKEPIRRGRASGPLTSQRVLILTVRLVDGQIGPLTFEGQPDHSGRTQLSIVDASGDLPLATDVDVDVHEFADLPLGAAGHAWADYPRLVEAIVRWIRSTLDAATPDPAPGQPPIEPLVLLMTRVPQEIGVGIGVRIAQSKPGQWPARVLPVVFDDQSRTLVIPGLDLGRESLLRSGGW